jgi:hypothetical protein
VRGFQLWFGVRPEVTPELRALVEADLAGGGHQSASQENVTAPPKTSRGNK